MPEHDEPEHNEMDRLLDSALSTYATPRPGLEDRVLRSLAATRAMDSENRRPRSARRWLSWAIAVPIAAAIVLLFLLARWTPAPPHNYAHSVPQFQRPATPLEQPQSSKVRAPSRAVHPVRRRATPAPEFAIRRDLPKQNIFPSPQPLSSEEQALVALAQAPEPVRQSLIEAQNNDEGPITISAIQIQPLKVPEPGQN